MDVSESTGQNVSRVESETPDVVGASSEKVRNSEKKSAIFDQFKIAESFTTRKGLPARYIVACAPKKHHWILDYFVDVTFFRLLVSTGKAFLPPGFYFIFSAECAKTFT